MARKGRQPERQLTNLNYYAMFNIKTVKALRNQLKALTIENEAVANSNKSLKNQRDTLVKENNELSVKIADITDEANKAMEAKEAERQELCDQLGELQQQRKKDKETIDRQSNTIGRIIKENAFLIKTNANLAQRLNLKRNDKNRFTKTN